MDIKRLLSPLTNPAGLLSASMAAYAAAVGIDNEVNHHGPFAAPVVVAAVCAVAALWMRQQVTPVRDPKDGNGSPLVAPPAAVTPPATGAHP